MSAKAKQVLPIFLLAIAGGAAPPAGSQTVAIDSDEIRIEDEFGNVDTELGSASLTLGRFLVGASLEVKNANGVPAFSVDAGGSQTTAIGTLRLIDLGSSLSVELNGFDGNAILGGSGADGDVILLDSTGLNTTVHIDGTTATATNALAGNGFVKGWARMKADGTLLSCYNCDSDPLKTLRTALGTYYVDFSPIASDISTRPRMAVLDKFDLTVSGVDTITLTDDNTGDPSRIRIFTGPAQDHSFTIMVY